MLEKTAEYRISMQMIKQCQEQKHQKEEQSVYEPDNPKATQENDMEEDLALLEDDMGW